MARILYLTFLIGFMLHSIQVVGAPAAKPQPNAVTAGHDDRRIFFGEPVLDAAGKLLYVAENKSQTQTHNKENYVMVRVKNIKVSKMRQKGRIRVAVWNDKATYAQEGVKPYRMVSYEAKDAANNEMLFRISGLSVGENLSFFAHFDEKDAGKIAKFLGIPTEQFIFSNGKNQGKGPGLSREGLSPPKFENTLVKYTGPGQEVVLVLK